MDLSSSDLQDEVIITIAVQFRLGCLGVLGDYRVGLSALRQLLRGEGCLLLALLLARALSAALSCRARDGA